MPSAAGWAGVFRASVGQDVSLNLLRGLIVSGSGQMVSDTLKEKHACWCSKDSRADLRLRKGSLPVSCFLSLQRRVK